MCDVSNNERINESLNALKQLIPIALINKRQNEICNILAKCLLAPYINNNTNIPQLIEKLKNGCPLLIESMSKIDLSMIENLADQNNQQVFINLIMGTIMSISTVSDITKSFNLSMNTNDIYDASFLILVTLLLVSLVEKSNDFTDFISIPTNKDALFKLLEIMETSYKSLLASSHLVKELKTFFRKIGLRTTKLFQKIRLKIKKYVIHSPPSVSTIEANEKISLRVLSFSQAIELSK